MLDITEIMNGILPDPAFGSCEGWNGFISEEQVAQSVSETCDFFGIEEPALTMEGPATGVFTNLDFTPADDVLFYNVEELEAMGVTGKDGFDLVMTHECAHRELQDMVTDFDAHQEELCCDFMIGVRAGLNGIDVSSLEHALGDTPETYSHPDGALRIDAIENGIEYAKEYLALNGEAPTFANCFQEFCESIDVGFGGDALHNDALDRQALLHELDAEECVMRHYKHLVDAQSEVGEFSPATIEKYEEALNRYEELKNNLADGTGTDDWTMDNTADEDDVGNDISFKGYTKSEIDSKVSKAESEMRSEESNMRHRKAMMESKARMGEPFSYEKSQYDAAVRRYNEAKSELQKWKNMKPDK